MLRKEIPLIVAVDSKDLFNPLSTQRNDADKLICADVNVIRYKFETLYDHKMVWVPDKLNLAEDGTRLESLLLDAFHVMNTSGRLPLQFTGAESRTSNKIHGSCA